MRMIKSKRFKMEEDGSSFKSLTSTATRKRLLGRLRPRWQDNIRIDLKKRMSIRGIGLIQLRIEIIGEPLRTRY